MGISAYAGGSDEVVLKRPGGRARTIRPAELVEDVAHVEPPKEMLRVSSGSWTTKPWPFQIGRGLAGLTVDSSDGSFALQDSPRQAA